MVLAATTWWLPKNRKTANDESIKRHESQKISQVQESSCDISDSKRAAARLHLNSKFLY